VSHKICYTTERGAYLRDKRQGFEADIVPASSNIFKENVAISTLITSSRVVLLNYAEEQLRIYVSIIYLLICVRLSNMTMSGAKAIATDDDKITEKEIGNGLA
jgi:hypothetical protein